ncbi:MAG: hypothetical protein N3F09_04365 [Bacteroidia bacterium]|nr:hypothetical protein [Bacteroidia bacterium]
MFFKIHRIVFFSFLTLVNFCKKKSPAHAEQLLGKEYFPLESGRYVVYDIDSLVYNDLTLTSTLYQYRIKEKFADTYLDNEGRRVWRLERYIKKKHPQKPYDSIPYIIKEVWKTYADNQKVEQTEKNVPYIKLIFPVEQGATWNGNALNTLGEQTYRYEYIDKAETINNISLEKVLSVEQKNTETLLSKDYFKEKYAKGIGLVYKEMVSVYSNTLNPSIPLMNRISGGFVYTQKLVQYGKE